MTFPIHTSAQAKARARAIRAALAAEGREISHTAALERVAREQGCASWNALSARLSNRPAVPLQTGERVAGSYLKQPFAGTVVSVRSLSDGAAFEVAIAFDEPVDVSAFARFSVLRRRVRATLDRGGVSRAKTGDGVPQLVVARL